MSDYDVSPIRQAGTTVPGLLVPVRTDRPRLPDTIGARRSADVRIDGLNGAVYVHVVFSVDDATNEVRIAVFDDAGQLVRIIPPKSVAEMLTTMAQYAGI